MICQICNKEIKSNCHISKKHHVSAKEYYDTYIRKENEGFCLNCGKETTFISITNGYHDYCSKSCSGIINNQKQEVKDKIKQTKLIRYGDENYHNMEKTKQTNKERYGNEYAIATKSVRNKIQKTQLSKNTNYDGLSKLSDVIDKYGYGWYIIRNQLNIITIMKGRYGYIKNEDISKIEDYIHSDFKHSKNEVLIYDSIKSYFNGEIIRNSNRIIKPYQIDLFIPSLNIAIEYNSKFYHCSEFGISEDYHLMKSLLCREKQIRLIHIYEFENIEEQLQLLKSLILGQDKYPKNDFNKNNLLDILPQPEIIYQTTRYTIYGAGKLY